MNTRKIFTALFTALLLSGSIPQTAGAQILKRKATSQGTAINLADNQSRHSHYVDPYLPRDFMGIAGPPIPCTEEGQRANNKASGGNCFDYRSPSTGTLWRIRYGGVGTERGMAERIFKHSENSMTLWVVFDVTRENMGKELYASRGARQQYLASGGNQNGQDQSQQADSNQNSPNISLPDINIGGVPLGSILNGIIRNAK
jgi:hypothetical protein